MEYLLAEQALVDRRHRGIARRGSRWRSPLGQRAAFPLRRLGGRPGVDHRSWPWSPTQLRRRVHHVRGGTPDGGTSGVGAVVEVVRCSCWTTASTFWSWLRRRSMRCCARARRGIVVTARSA